MIEYVILGLFVGVIILAPIVCAIGTAVFVYKKNKERNKISRIVLTTLAAIITYTIIKIIIRLIIPTWT
jgi:hypothetical protein